MGAPSRFTIKSSVQNRANESRGKILKAAAEAFSDHPYESVTIREVAKDAAVKHQLIAYYFGNKEELWKTVVEFLYDEFNEIGSFSFSDSSLSAEEQLKLHLRGMIEFTWRKPELFRIVMKEMVNPGPRMEVIKKHMLHFAEISFMVFDEARGHGYFQQIENEELYFIISGAMTHRLLFPEMNRLITGHTMDEKQLDAHVNSVMQLLIGHF